MNNNIKNALEIITHELEQEKRHSIAKEIKDIIEYKYELEEFSKNISYDELYKMYKEAKKKNIDIDSGYYGQMEKDYEEIEKRYMALRDLIYDNIEEMKEYGEINKEQDLYDILKKVFENLKHYRKHTGIYRDLGHCVEEFIEKQKEIREDSDEEV